MLPEEFRLLAIDPGETTAVVLFDRGDIICAEISLWHGVEEIISTRKPDLIVCESFRLYPGMASRLANHSIVPAEVIGAIREIAERHHVPICFQNASIAKAIELGYMKGFESDHVYDAARHGIAYLQRKHLMLPEYNKLLNVEEKRRRGRR